MAEEQKKRIYGGSYDDAISDTYREIANRPAYSYDVDGDALYQQYKERYIQNAKNAMKDTMGQAAALTGGYGNSYAQSVGQQRYDETMRGLTDMIPTLEGRAYERWQAQGNALQNRLSMLHSMGQAESEARNTSYSQIANLISTTGYRPTEQDLANSGMTQEQADAMLQWWITNNPDAAYNNGQLSRDDYYRLTGRYPTGNGPQTVYQPQQEQVSQEALKIAYEIGSARPDEAQAIYEKYLQSGAFDSMNQASKDWIIKAVNHATRTGEYAPHNP